MFDLYVAKIQVHVHRNPLYWIITENISKSKKPLRYTLNRLQKMFDIVHIAPNNNCPYLEKTDGGQVVFYDCMDITFLNRAMRKHDPIKISRFPHTLDAKHVEHKPAVDYSFLERYIAKF